MNQIRQGAVRIGTSGWQYDHWKGVLYPDLSSPDDWFEIYADRFDTVEVNNTFYHLPDATIFDAWHDQAPPGFRYTLKFSRYGSHLKKLKDPAGSIGNFCERAERLKAYLGPVLVQLPPHWHVDVDRLDTFLAEAPRRIRWAVEFRDPSWLCEEVYDCLRRHGAALCIHDMIEDHPREITGGWVYLRYHGPEPWGCYSHQALSAEARRIRRHLDHGRDVYAYFNNDAEGYAVRNAADLARYVDG